MINPLCVFVIFCTIKANRVRCISLVYRFSEITLNKNLKTHYISAGVHQTLVNSMCTMCIYLYLRFKERKACIGANLFPQLRVSLNVSPHLCCWDRFKWSLSSKWTLYLWLDNAVTSLKLALTPAAKVDSGEAPLQHLCQPLYLGLVMKWFTDHKFLSSFYNLRHSIKWTIDSERV